MTLGEALLSSTAASLLEEFRHRAIAFSKEWAAASKANKPKSKLSGMNSSMFSEFRRRVVATFEEPVKKISGDYGFIDLFWPAAGSGRT